MCVYCNMGDHAFKFHPPFPVPNSWPQRELIPQPLVQPIPQPWELQRLIEYRDLLKEIRDLEAKVGCPCEPNKADYIALFDQQIAEMKKKRDELARQTGA